MNRAAYWALLLLIVALALALRVPNLAQRPMHNDEGVNAVKFDEVRRTGQFPYDPNEYHGPTLFYLTVPVAWVSGARTFAETTEVTLRGVPVIFGVGLILLLPLIADGIGRGGVLWAALFTACSPAMVYYSRYYIHEVPLVFFAFAAIACGWRYRRSGRLAWAAAAGAAVGLCYATKETWVLALAAAAASAVAAAVIWRVLLKGKSHRLHVRSRALLVATIAFAVVFVALFSSFFTRFQGVADALGTYFHYGQRGSGGDHDKPWYYYLQILTFWRVKGGPWWSEGEIVALALLGFGLAVLRRHKPHAAAAHAAPDRPRPMPPAAGGPAVPERQARSAARDPRPDAPDAEGHPARSHPGFTAYPPFVRFLSFYTLFLTAAFSVIPYKTPWCMLGFLHGMILLAGFACGQVVHLMPHWAAKAALALVFAGAAGHLGRQADRATNNVLDPKHPNYFAASRYNPYVYAHTGTDVANLLAYCDKLAAVAPAGRRLSIDVVTADCWPVPFYLRAFPNVGYFQSAARGRGADVVIGTDDDYDRLAGDDAERKYVGSSFGLRTGVLLTVYVRGPLYEKLKATWQPAAAATK